jgi:hypothetical protein
MGEERGVLRVLVGKPEGKRTLGRPRPRLEYKIRMDLWEEVVYRFLVGKPKEKRNWGNLGVVGFIILEWI